MISYHTTHAQVDTLLASQYYNKADSFLEDRKLDSSIVYYKKALPIYQKANAWERVASTYNGLSESKYYKSEYKNALINAEKALEICDNHLFKNHKEEAIAYTNLGSVYYKWSDFQKAFINYQKSLDIKQKIFPELHKNIAVSYSNLALLYNTMSKYEKAIVLHKKALDIDIKLFGGEHTRVGNDYYNLANTKRSLGKHSQALKYYQKSLEITIKNKGDDHLSAGYNYVGLGGYYSDLNQNNNALVFYQKGLSIFRKNESLYPLFVAYSNVGLILSDKGEYNKSLQYHKKGLDVGLKILDKNHLSLGFCYWNIGLVYDRKDEKEIALEYYNKALQICKLAYREDHPDIGDLYIAIGNIYIDIKDYKNGLSYHTNALNVYKEVFKAKNPKLSSCYLGISNLYLEQGDYEQALFYSEKAINILKELYDEKSPLLIESLFQIAKINSKRKAYDKADLFYDKAIFANFINETYQIKDQVFNPNQYHNSKFLLKTLKGKGKTLQLRYLKENKISISDLEQCNIIYKEADILINHIRQSFHNYQDKIALAKQAKEIYADAIQAQLLLYKNKQNRKSLEQAFYYAEKSKANTLKGLLSESNAKNFAKLPDTLLGMEKVLKTDQAFYQSQIIDEKSNTSSVDSTKIKEYENKLFDINRKQDSLTLVLEKNYPKYHQFKYKNDIISVIDIQQQLDDKTTLLEFFTGDSISYAFTISKNDIAVQELATSKLTEQVEEFSKSIIDQDVRSYKKQASALYNKLIAPIADKLVGGNLIIVPDGSLWHLNFELLLTQEDESNNPVQLSYLLKDYAITYANSANLLFGAFKTNSSSETLQECLAFSFSDSTQTRETRTMRLENLRGTGDDLPGTRKEIRAIADIIDGQYYYGSQAVEANFKSNASQYNILHLALHGDVDNERPENSKLYFTKNKDTIEDNLLYSHELFALDIPAELTVLSACNTGTGKIAKGEGIMSLGNAFQYAGTKSLLLTSWEVSDQTTPELMKYFYTNLKAGMNKSKALQQAKLKYLTTADINRTNPFYWGGFYLIGDTAPMHFENNSALYWILGLGVLGILLLAMFWSRRKKKN